MENKYSYGYIWRIAYPILISLVMEQLIGMTDTAFLGRVGELELGASAIASIYYLIIFMLGFGFSIGAQILIARRNGSGDFKEIGNIFYHGLYFLLVMATVICIISVSLSPQILNKVVSSPAICERAVSYINWRIFGLLFSFTAAMFRAFFVGTTQTKTLTLNSIIMVLSNIVFNYILIFGKFGVPALGIAGAAIGSTLAEMVSCIFFIIYTKRRVDYRKYGLNSFGKFKFGDLKKIMNLSVWTMIQNFLSIATWFLFFIYIEHLGERDCEQHDRLGKYRNGQTGNKKTYHNNLLYPYSGTYTVLHISTAHHKYLHGHNGSSDSIHTVSVCTVLILYICHSGIYLLQFGFRNRKYQDGIQT